MLETSNAEHSNEKTPFVSKLSDTLSGLTDSLQSIFKKKVTAGTLSEDEHKEIPENARIYEEDINWDDLPPDVAEKLKNSKK